MEKEITFEIEDITRSVYTVVPKCASCNLISNLVSLIFQKQKVIVKLNLEHVINSRTPSVGV